MDILTRAAQWWEQGHGAALVTLVEIRGGAARALGAQMAVRADGLYCGYISGGCTEAAVAAEAMQAIENGLDRFLKLGEGSPFFDIMLPCGGGLNLAIHVLRSSIEIRTMLEQVMNHRSPASLAYDPATQRLTATSDIDIGDWRDGIFLTSYRPKVRLLLAGSRHEVEMCAKVGRAMEYDVSVISDRSRMCWHFDADTAVALLFHDLDKELPVLRAALESDCFYIGALGSKRTHERRVKALEELGVPAQSMLRIKAPIGLIPKARDTATIAVSVMAEIAATRKNN
ncbi:XdhC family protein [Brucella sp. BE17]|uniref:XdhC family protein n=1 Tax=Brucella sp. BE17 TaxID=3142977 RepID=UPI0031BADAA6